jgi:hypothetical protein
MSSGRIALARHAHLHLSELPAIIQQPLAACLASRARSRAHLAILARCAMETHALARDAVRHAIANDDVSPTKHLLAEEADATPFGGRQKIAAFRTGNGRINLPHDSLPG